MTDDLVVDVGDLIGHPGKERLLSGSRPIQLRVGETTVNGEMKVEGVVTGLLDAVRADFSVTSAAKMTCTRCTKQWDHQVWVDARQYFGKTPDEDGYAIVDASIDVGAPAKDELALGLPMAPLCRADCRGLCPTCGTDLNTEPCDGHGEDRTSPFSVLKDLFDS